MSSGVYGEDLARHALRRALENESDFYRRHYAGLPDVAEMSWCEVPTLARTNIQDTPLFRRLFVPRSDLDAIRTTSGTSGKGILPMPRLLWRAAKGYARAYTDMYARLAIKRNLSFSGGQYLYSLGFRDDLGIDTLAIDQGDDTLFLRVVAAYKPDMLAGFAYVLTHLAPRMPTADRSRVRAVQVFGERCTPLEWQQLQAAFPNAALVSEYASIEAQTIVAMPCWSLIEDGSQALHPVAEYMHVEVLNETGTPLSKEGDVGEAVITTLQPLGFPLVRYRTGDLVRIVSRSCPCGAQTPIIAVEGRVDTERVRIFGGELNLAGVEHAVLSVYGDKNVQYRFEVQKAERGSSHESLLHVTVRVEGAQTDAAQLARLADALYVAPGVTYAALVARGDALPLVWGAYTSREGKTQRLVRTDPPSIA